MKIWIPRLEYQKVMHWVQRAPNEVSGFGLCSWNRELASVVIHRAFLSKQESGSATTELDATALSQLMYQTRDEPGELQWWWHSHANMATFWSNTDSDTIQTVAANGWLAATVFNKRGENLSALSVGQGSLPGTWDDIPFRVFDPAPEENLVQQWDQEYADKVVEKTYTCDSPWVTPYRPWEKYKYFLNRNDALRALDAEDKLEIGTEEADAVRAFLYTCWQRGIIAYTEWMGDFSDET